MEEGLIEYNTRGNDTSGMKLFLARLKVSSVQDIMNCRLVFVRRYTLALGPAAGGIFFTLSQEIVRWEKFSRERKEHCSIPNRTIARLESHVDKLDRP
jgi:hypothetical protein